MPLIASLPLLPQDAVIVSDTLAVQDDGTYVVFFNAAGPIYSCRRDDQLAIRLGAVTVIEQDLASVAATAAAITLHKATLFRELKRFREDGAMGLLPKRRGPRGPHKLTPSVLRQAQRALNRGDSIRSAAEGLPVGEGALRAAMKRGLLTAPSGKKSSVPTAGTEATGPSTRAAEDQGCEAGTAVKRTLDRALARSGHLIEAEPGFRPAESVPGAGVLLALPALEEQGLLEVGQEVYGALRNGFFGLRPILLTFAFMALLRIKAPEQLTEHAPAELGILLGLDRAQEVKTLRRNLSEMGERKLAHTYSGKLTERWARAEPRELAILYIDGHVRPYNGRTHTLPKLHVQQRDRAMPGTKDFHVNDRQADPLLFMTANATEGMLSTLESTLLPEVRELVGPRRRITIAFDREGWSPKLFAKWKEEKFDVLTYRKGKQTIWQKRFFSQVVGKVNNRPVEYCLAERRVKLTNGLRVREIRRLCDSGHQTSIITTNEKLPLLEVAYRMFSRWKQENFFRYMKHEFALDHLCTYEVEPADPKRLVTSPERKELQKKLRAARAARTKLIERHGELKPGKKIRAGKKMVDEEELDGLIIKRDAEIRKLDAALAPLPKKVPLDTVLVPEKIVKLERERKVLVDAIKLTAFRAESALARLVEPLFKRHEDEARKLLKSIFKATADVLPDERKRQLTIRFHGLANARATRALADLCVLMTERETLYPGTDLRLRFEAPMLQK
jgi:hypothetical protein